MKKYLIILLSICLTSCSIDDSVDNNYQLQLLPIESVTMPDALTLKQRNEITVTYIRPTNCYAFNDFYYVIDGNQRTVAILNTVFNNNNCQEINQELEASFDFLPTKNQTYVFKFWKGQNENGEDIYLTMEVPVEP